MYVKRHRSFPLENFTELNKISKNPEFQKQSREFIKEVRKWLKEKDEKEKEFKEVFRSR